MFGVSAVEIGDGLEPIHFLGGLLMLAYVGGSNRLQRKGF